MSLSYWLLLAVLTLMPANAQAAGQPLTESIVPIEHFWKHCDQRHQDAVEKLWCLTYVLGHFDAAIEIGQVTKARVPFCMDTGDVNAMLERIISHIPPGTRGSKDPAGLFVQAAIVKAARCD